MYITVYEHVQTMSERIQTIYEHFAVVLLNLLRQQYEYIGTYTYIRIRRDMYVRMGIYSDIYIYIRI